MNEHEMRYLVEFALNDRIQIAAFNAWGDAETFVVNRCKGLGCSLTLYPITDLVTNEIEFINLALLEPHN